MDSNILSGKKVIVKLVITSEQVPFCAYKKNRTAELCQRLVIAILRQTLASNEIDISEFDSEWKFRKQSSHFRSNTMRKSWNSQQ